MSAGLGSFGSMSITNLAKDFRSNLMEDLCVSLYNLEDVTKRALEYFKGEYEKIYNEPIAGQSFEFWIGGYSHDNKHGEIWKIEMHNGEWIIPVQLVRPETDNQVILGGQTQAIGRLLLGYDAFQLNRILEAQRLDANQLQQIKLQLSSIHTPLVDPAMPVQDAIDLADFLVDLTKRHVAFLPGADTVGGETDIATVTKHEGFKWIRRKHYYPPHLNRRETDHVT